MTFTYKKKSARVDVATGDNAALWLVGKDYSDDCFYISVWKNSELQALPACADPVLLAHVSVNDQGAIVDHFKAKGVTYAQN